MTPKKKSGTTFFSISAFLIAIHFFLFVSLYYFFFNVNSYKLHSELRRVTAKNGVNTPKIEKSYKVTSFFNRKTYSKNIPFLRL